MDDAIPQERARETAELQLRYEEALRDARTPAERRAAVAEVRAEWRLRSKRAEK